MGWSVIIFMRPNRIWSVHLPETIRTTTFGVPTPCWGHQEWSETRHLGQKWAQNGPKTTKQMPNPPSGQH